MFNNYYQFVNLTTEDTETTERLAIRREMRSWLNRPAGMPQTPRNVPTGFLIAACRLLQSEELSNA